MEKVLRNHSIDASNADKTSWSSDAMKKFALGTIIGIGTGASVAGVGAALFGTGTGATTLTGTAGLHFLTASGGLASAAGVGAAAVPVMIVALPVALFTGGIAAGIWSHFKNEGEKERLRNEYTIYMEAIKKQNRIISEIILEKERIYNKYNKTYDRMKILEEINQKLTEYIRNLESDLHRGGLITT